MSHGLESLGDTRVKVVTYGKSWRDKGGLQILYPTTAEKSSKQFVFKISLDCITLHINIITSYRRRVEVGTFPICF